MQSKGKGITIPTYKEVGNEIPIIRREGKFSLHPYFLPPFPLLPLPPFISMQASDDKTKSLQVLEAAAAAAPTSIQPMMRRVISSIAKPLPPQSDDSNSLVDRRSVKPYILHVQVSRMEL